MNADVTSLIIYGGTLLITILLCLYVQKRRIKNIRQKIFYALLISMPFVLLSAFRYGIGTDYFNYIELFERISQHSLHSNVVILKIEPLFVLGVKLMLGLNFSASLMFGVLAFVCIFFPVLALVENKNKLNIAFAFLLYYLIFFHYSLNMIRQLMAIGIIMYVLPKLFEKKLWRYIIGVIIAAGLHSTAIACLVFLIVPFLGTVSDPELKPRATFTVRQFVFYALILLSPILMTLLVKVVLMIPFLSHFSKYLSGEIELGLGLWMAVCIIFIPMFVLSKAFDGDKALVGYRDLALFYIPFSFVGYMGQYMERVSFYSNMVFILLIPMLCRGDKKNGKWLAVYYTAYFLMEYINLFIIGSAGETFPYVSIFTQ